MTDPEDEAGRGENPLEPPLNAGVEGLLLRAAGSIEAEQDLDFVLA